MHRSQPKNPRTSYVIYKLQRLNKLEFKESSLTVLETISMTTSYTKAMEIVMENPTYFLVPHTVHMHDTSSFELA